MLAIIIMGTLLPIFAGTPDFGVQGMGIFHTMGKHDKHQHRSEMQVGAYARWNLSGGHGALLQLNVTPVEPVLAAAYYIYNFEQARLGYYGMIGVTSIGPSFGLGYDFNKNFGVQTTFSTGHNTFGLGTCFTF
jgi:hypothetical protein